jgi:hypothetical protein
MRTATISDRSVETNEAPDRLTETLERKLSHPATSPDFDLHAATNEVLKDIVPIADNVVGWLGTTGILAALRQRAIEGGSYRVVVSLTRTVLWLLSLGIFDKAYAQQTAGSADEHTYVAPDLFTAETPLGTYQGLTDQVVMPKTPGSFRTVLAPRGSSKPEWLTLRK